MIAANIVLADKYAYLNPVFTKCYQWLASHDIVAMADGTYEICEQAHAIVQRYQTLPESACRFEAHFENIDIQYVAAGVESFGVCAVQGLRVSEERRDEDVVFFDKPEHWDQVVLSAGKFCLLTPEEAHQPRACYQDQLSDVTKVVIKIKI